jgi:toxin-antitoxin system PIN domain toxin
MKPYLLDTNILIALAWPSHVHHQLCQRWFARRKRAGFRTCPLTETGFVRICSNPAFSKNAVSPIEALSLLRQITELPGHGFWPDDVSLVRAMGEVKSLSGHRQITDAYLLALAHTRQGVLATLDEGVLHLAPEKGRVEIPSETSLV